RVGQQFTTSVVDGDDALSDITCAIGNDGSGGNADMPVPGLIRLRVPGDLHRLPHGEFANLRFVEVGVNLNFVKVRNVDQILSGRDEIVGGYGDGVDGPGNRCPDIEGCI